MVYPKTDNIQASKVDEDDLLKTQSPKLISEKYFRRGVLYKHINSGRYVFFTCALAYSV